MGNVAFFALMLAGFGLTSGRRMSRKCTFCRYFFATGNSPYDLLWILSDEISSYLSEDQRITLFLDEEDLTKAELVFEIYCERTCAKDHLPASSEMVADVAFSGLQSANKPGSGPSGPNYGLSSQTPSIRTLFSGIKIYSPPKREKSEGEYSGGGPESGAPENMSEGLGASAQSLGASLRMNAANGGTNGKEGSFGGLARAPSKAFGVYPGGYRIPGTVEFSDGSDKYKSRSEGLSSAGMKYPNAAGISGNDEDNKDGAAVADTKRTDYGEPSS